MKRLWIAVCLILIAAPILAFTVSGRPAPGGVAAGGGGIDLTLESATTSRASRINITINKPSNTVDGDFLLAAVSTSASATSVTAPAGWTQIGSTVETTDTTRINLSIYYKRASSEGASWTWTHSSSNSAGAVWRLQGVVSSGDPQDATLSSVKVDYATGPITNASINTGTNNATVIQIATQYYEAQSLTTHTLTNRVLVGDTLSIDADLQASSGATGSKSVGKSDYDFAVGILIAIKPQ